MHSNKTQETRDTKNFPWGNHKEENLATSSEIESAPKVKPENIKMISLTAAVSLLSQQILSLTHAPQWVSVYIATESNRKAHSLFIFFHSLEVHSNMPSSLNNYLLEPTSLGVSNNPSAPPLVGTLTPPINRWVTQWWGLFPWLKMTHLESNSLG